MMKKTRKVKRKETTMFTMNQLHELIGKTVKQNVSIDDRTILFVTGDDLWGFDAHHTPCHSDRFSYIWDAKNLIGKPIESIEYQKANKRDKIGQGGRDEYYYEILFTTANGETTLGITTYPCDSCDGMNPHSNPELIPTRMVSPHLPVTNGSANL